MVFRQSTYEAHKHKKSFDSKLPHIGAFFQHYYRYRNWQLFRNGLFTAQEVILLCLALFRFSETCPVIMPQNQQNYVYIFFLVTILLIWKKRESAITSLFVISTPHPLLFIWFTFMNGGAGSIFLPLRLTAKNRYSNNLRNMLN